MRKSILTLTIVLLACLTALGQGKVTTKKYRLADFPDKITKVVLPGSGLLDGALRQEVTASWTLSAFEFCGWEEFEALKTQDRYYFLLVAESRFKGEENPGISFLTLIKGGPEAAEGIGAMNEVLSLPLCAAQGGSGRELVYLGAYIQAMQDFTQAAMESEKVAYSGSDWFNGQYNREGKMQKIYMAQEDLSESIKAEELEKYLDDDFLVVEASEADAQFQSNAYNTLSSYVVAPFLPSDGASYSYQLLFQAHTQKLFYITRHKIKGKVSEGFTADDLKRLSKKR